MTSPYTHAHLAEGRIRLATARLLAKYPFHARVLERFWLAASASIVTMGVTAARTSVLLLFNPDFVLRLPPDQLGGVLLHEVLHVVLGHLTVNPADYPDSWALTVALEVSVNEFVHESLPPGVIRREQFPMLPPMESSEERYRRLEQLRDRADIGTPTEILSGAGDGRTSVLDDHGVWAEAFTDLEATRKAVADLVQAAAMDAGGLPPELRHATMGMGSEAGHGVRIIRDRRHGRLDWQRLLRSYVGQVLEPQPSYHRPPRRFPHLVGILPGRHRCSTRPSVVAVIDTSGSITDDHLKVIDGELRRLSRAHPVHIVESDCMVHRVFPYRRPLESVTGGGGTDFRPALEPSLLRPLRPGLVVYFTDGLGEAPVVPPPWPLVWCLVAGSKRPAPYGRVVAMGPENAR